MTAADWVDVEAQRGFRRELRRLRRRALRRPLLTFFLAALAAALAVGYTARKPRTYRARVIFRVAEAHVDVGGSPRPKRNLREYVWDAAFSTEKLLKVIQEHHLYPAAMARDPALALDAIRHDIDIQVYRNYFIQERQEDSPLRSARLVITFTALEPDLALAIAQELGEIVIDYEARSRRELTGLALRDADQVARQEEAELQRLSTRLSEAQLRLQLTRGSERAAVQAEISALYRSIPAAEVRARQAQAEARELRLRAAFEQNQSGLRFELVDAAALAGIRRSPLSHLVLVGVLALLLALPLAGMAVGAFDPRVYDADDAGRLGLHVLGHVPPFRGDQIGSLRRRLDAPDRVR